MSITQEVNYDLLEHSLQGLFNKITIIIKYNILYRRYNLGSINF